ncbi:uncharacterized protein LOC106804527 [Setaria italica]|uniref:uncharacterized protein LOC106804527 n=1 Tax=Setaria italica TaxID=4555 RepID=UPI000351177D|nr:uncharacterized protein LOC106804527 [Setaria italica]
MKDLGTLHHFLGMHVQQSGDGLLLSQRQFMLEILDHAGMTDCTPCATPIDTNPKLSAAVGVPLTATAASDYRSLAGALQYLTFTRPDIAYAVQQSDLIAYSDANWAGCPDTRKSTSGNAVFLGDNLVSWSSKRQNAVSRSSAEAEYRAIANTVAEIVWLRQLVLKLRAPLRHTALVYCDNVSTIYMSSNPVQHQCTKHIDIDLHFVRERIATGDVRVLHVPTTSRYAGIFTKGLPSSVFTKFRSSLNVQLTGA